MTNPLLITLAVSAAFLASACTQPSPTDLPPGTYVNKSSTTNRDGTNYDQKTTTKVGYDEYGNKTAVVKTKTTKDPEGLFNKSTTKSTTVVK